MRRTRNVPRAVGLVLLSLVAVGPLYWIASSSLKPPAEIISKTPTLVPHEITLQHYDKLFNSSPFSTYLVNSLIAALATVVITVVLAVLGAYGLYRSKARGRNAVFHTILVTYAFPATLILIPIYGMFSSLGLIDSLVGLVIVNVTFAAPFAIWLLRAFFRSVPRSIEEAALLDGASSMQTLTKVIIPLTAPGIASVSIYAFVIAWTEYMFASVLILSDSHRTLPVGLAGIIGQYQIDWGLLLAGATLTAVPVILLFALVGKHFVAGLSSGAIK